jgi:UDP-glucose 4-epimerase
VSVALVTGGAGFIGSHLVHALLEKGHTVRVLDSFATGRRENLAPFASRVTLFEGDVCDAALVRRAMSGAEWVLHHAAIPSVQRSLEDPMASHRANAEGTLNVLLAAREAGVKRVVYASSSSVYGNAPGFARHEGEVPAPESPYAASKLAGEQYALAFHRSFGLTTVSLRYFNVFGPRQDPHSAYAAVIPRFVTAALRGERPVIYGDGLQSRDFTYVANVVAANLRACLAPDVGGKVFNVAAGSRTTLLEVLEALGRNLGRGITPEHAAPRAGEVRHSQANIERAHAELGYAVEIPFDEGLRRTIDWYAARAGVVSRNDR